MSTKNDTENFYQQVRRSLEGIDDPGRLKGLSRIEVDLIKEQLRDLYDRLSGIRDEQQKEVAPQEKKQGPVEVELDIKGTPALSPSIVEEEIHQSESEMVEIGSEELIAEKITPKEPDPPPDGKDGQPDLFSTGEGNGNPGKKSVAEAIRVDDAKESVADKLQKQAKVNSLKSSIGINEKFFFINELFDGNLNEYNAAIEGLDGMATPDEAAGLLEELASRYKWDDHDEAAGQLKEFLERKFS